MRKLAMAQCVIFAMIMIIPAASLKVFSNPFVRAGSGPDFIVTDIWQGAESWMIGCTIENRGDPYSGYIFVNLSVNHQNNQSYEILWMGEGSHQNVTFEAGYDYIDGQMEVMVEVVLINGPDANQTDNVRIETWDLIGPDLFVENIFVHPISFNLTAIVANGGISDLDTPFHLSLYINGSYVQTISFNGAIRMGEKVSIPLNWVWDRVSTRNITVYVDGWSEVMETNESNNQFSRLIERWPDLSFITPPAVKGLGPNNATLTWSCSIPAKWSVHWGTYPSLWRTSETLSRRRNGTLELTSLNDKTFYIFSVVGVDDFGRRLEGSGWFVTLSATGAAGPRGSFNNSKIWGYSPLDELPLDVWDDQGIENIEILLDGYPVGNFTPLGADRVNGIPLDIGPITEGNHSISFLVRDVEGNERAVHGNITWQRPEMEQYPAVSFQNQLRPLYSGISLLSAAVEDPDGIQRITWYVDDEVVFVDEPPEGATTYSSNFFWNTEMVANGYHTVHAEVLSNLGKSSSLISQLRVNNEVEQEEPDLEVMRLPLTSSGTSVNISLSIHNLGSETALDVTVRDNIEGFIPISGFSSAHSIDDDATVWTVELNAGMIEPGGSIEVSYECVPVMNMHDRRMIGWPMILTTHPRRVYTTKLNWYGSESDTTYVSYRMLSAAYFEDGSDLDEGTMSILSDANYVLVTTPERLFDRMVPREDVDILLIKGAVLSSLRTGVVAFLDGNDQQTWSAEGVRFILNNMADDLHPDYRSKGYLAILGEDDVIPADNYPITGSDQIYTNLEGGNLPNIIVGRFIGDSPGEIMPQLDTAIGMARGELVNDPTGSALLISGGWDGEESFRSNTEDLRESIESKMDTVTTHHIHEILDLSTMDFDMQVFDGCMAAGDMDGDGKGEVAVLDQLNSSVVIINPDTKTQESHPIYGVVDGRILAAQIDEDPEIELIILSPMGSGVGFMNVYDQPFSLLWRTWITFGAGSEACTLDYNGDGKDEVAVTDPDTDEIYILSRTGQLMESIKVNQIDSFSRIGFADMNADGYGDFIITTNRGIDGYAGPDWTVFCVDWDGLPSTSGFTAGDIGLNGVGRVVILRPDNKGSKIISLYNHETPPLITYATSPVALTHAEMMGDGGPPELVLISNGSLRIMDLEKVPERFQELISPEMPGKDIIFYRDHGSETEWVSVINSSSMANIPFDSSIHRPVIFGSACSTGNFVDTDDSFAEACMKAGAGVYIGATIPSYRNLNNFANRMIKDFVDGTPIGIAFRDVERSLINQGARCWAYKYNLYGDPAFGTDGRPVTVSRVNTLKLLHMTRSQGSIELNVVEPKFRETGEGLQAFLEGGAYTGYENAPYIPYVSFDIDLGSGMVISNVSVSMLSDWTYYEDLFLGIGNISATDHMGRAPDEGLLDSYISWTPEEFFDWKRSELPNGNASITLRLFPFQYDMSSGIGRFCGRWSLNIETVEDTISIEDIVGPGSLSEGFEEARFHYTVVPAGTVTVSISHRIEDGSGITVRDLMSRIVTLESPLLVADICSGLSPGKYSFVTSVTSLDGILLEEARSPFSVIGGTTELGLSVESTTFNEGDVVTISVTVNNSRSDPLSGNYRISLIDDDMEEVETSSGVLTVPSLGTSHFDISFEMSGLSRDRYHVMGEFISDEGSAYDSLTLFRNGTEPEREQIVSMNLTAFLSKEVFTAGEELWVNGSVQLGGQSLPGAGVFIIEESLNLTVNGQTDASGSFSVPLNISTPGNWTLNVICVMGPYQALKELPVVVLEGELPGNGTGNGTTSNEKNDEWGWLLTALVIVLLPVAFLGILFLLIIRKKRGRYREE